MSPEYSDSTQAETDISGTPPPVRSRGKISGDTGRKVNQSRRGPQADQQPQGDENPLQQLGDKAGGAVEGAGDWLRGQSFAQPSQSWNPVDWAKEYEQDASTVYGLTKGAYQRWQAFVNPDRWHRSIQDSWQHDDALSKTARTILPTVAGLSEFVGASGQMGPAQVLPGVGAIESLNRAKDVLGGEKDVVTGQQTQEQASAKLTGQEQQREHGALDTAPQTVTNPLNYLPQGRIGAAAMVGAPVMQALMSSDPHERDSATAWVVLAGALFGLGHIPPSARAALLSKFGRAPEVLQQILSARQKLEGQAAKMQSPDADHLNEWVEQALAEGGYEGSVQRVRKGAEEGVREVPAEIKDTGEIKVLQRKAIQEQQALLRRAGATSAEDLVQHAAAGIEDPKKVKAVLDGWKRIGLPYDLRRVTEADAPLRDPRAALQEIEDGGDEKLTKQAKDHLAAVHVYLDQIRRGLFASSHDPSQALMRSMAGHSRATDIAHEYYMTTAMKLGKDLKGTDIARAIEDPETYKDLAPEAKLIVDGFRLLTNAIRHEAQGTDYAQSFRGNYFPRLDLQPEEVKRPARGRPSNASLLATRDKHHREEAIRTDEQGQLFLGQRFRTVQEANAAMAAGRKDLIEHLLDSTQQLRKDVADDPEAQGIRRVLPLNPTEAAKRAEQLALDRYAPKETDFFKAANRSLARQAKAIRTAHALHEFTQSEVETKHPTTGLPQRAIAAIRPANQRHAEQLADSDYRHIEDRRFQGFMFHNKVADDLERYVRHVSGSGNLSDVKAFQIAMKLEGKAIGTIMYSPMIHGMNILGRAGAAFLMHPLAMTHYLLNGKALSPHQLDEASMRLRIRAANNGLVSHYKNRNYYDSLSGRMQDAMGDMDAGIPGIADGVDDRGLKRKLASMVPHPVRYLNNQLWGHVNDFGVMMSVLEEEAAKSSGKSAVDAALWAGRRGNTWMGMVAPEDTNPNLHDAARLAFFAPNWWRSWGELLVPAYRRSGMSKDMALFRASQGIKTAVALAAFGQISGNLLNYALSGHWQFQNEPQNRFKLEATADWLNNLPGFSGTPASDPKTGAKRTIENPFGRFQADVAGAMGLTTGYPDWSPTDVWDGTTKQIAARFSPLLDASAGLMNFDIYRSVADHQWRNVNPNLPTGAVSPGSAIAGVLSATPLGIDYNRYVTQQMAQGQPVDNSLFGTHVPGSVQEALKDIKDPAENMLFSAITGVNPAHSSVQRTRGETLSDADYQKLRDIKDTYNQESLAQSAAALSGQMTPGQWLRSHQALATAHREQVKAIYGKHPQDYVNGALGMSNLYEGLYDQATDPLTGEVDFQKLDALQQKFRQQHTPEQLSQMDSVLSHNATRDPMLKLYHQALDDYRSWQEDYASQNGIDISTLQADLGEHGKLSRTDRVAATKFAREHRDVARFTRAKTAQFERTNAGMLYALFHGGNRTVTRNLQVQGLTPEDFLQEQMAS